MNSTAARSPPPEMSTVAPDSTSIAGAVSAMFLAGGVVSEEVVALLACGAYVQVTPSWVSP